MNQEQGKFANLRARPDLVPVGSGDFESLADNLAAAVVLVDAAGRARRVSARAACVLGLDDEDIGWPLADAIGDDFAEGLESDISGVLKQRAEPRERDINAGKRWYRRRITRRHGETGAVVSFAEVTQQRGLNATLESRVRERVRTLELLQQVAATVNSAHSIDAAFQQVIDAVCEFLGWTVGHAYAVPPTHDTRFSQLDVWSNGARRDHFSLIAAWRKLAARPGEGLFGVVDMPESAAWIEINSLTGLERRGKSVAGFKPTLALLMPVRVGDHVVAAVEFYRAYGGARRKPVLPLINQVGSELGYIVERQQLELRTLRQQRGLAQVTRLAVIGEMAGSIAHQLNQPLTAILNYVSAGKRLLASESPDAEKMRKVYERVDEQARRASSYIGHMRDYARKRKSRLKPMDAHVPVESAISLALPAARSAGITIETSFDRSLPRIYVDSMQLEQVFIGLLMNAVEAMEDSGDDRVVRVGSTRLDPGRLRLSVHDRGHGIPDDVLSSIFEPFFSTREGSIGMGLAVGRSIIESFGGRIAVERVPPHGVKFHVDLPIEDRAGNERDDSGEE
jgi:C4-dicarboxylate-specific signal transduction histidine kinase